MFNYTDYLGSLYEVDAKASFAHDPSACLLVPKTCCTPDPTVPAQTWDNPTPQYPLLCCINPLPALGGRFTEVFTAFARLLSI